MQLIVGDKRVNVTVRAKGAMVVIIALQGEELHKAGLPSCYIEVRRVPPATCHLVGGRGQRCEDYESMYDIMMNCLINPHSLKGSSVYIGQML